MPPNALSAYKPTIRDQLDTIVRGQASTGGVRNALADGLFGGGPSASRFGLADFSPLGLAMAVQEGRREWNRARTPGQRFSGAVTMATGIPLPMAKGVKGGARAAKAAADAAFGTERVAVKPAMRSLAEARDQLDAGLITHGQFMDAVQKSSKAPTVSGKTFRRNGLIDTRTVASRIAAQAQKLGFETYVNGSNLSDSRYVRVIKYDPDGGDHLVDQRIRVSNHDPHPRYDQGDFMVGTHMQGTRWQDAVEHLKNLSKVGVAEPGSISGGHLSMLNRPEPLLGSANGIDAQVPTSVKLPHNALYRSHR